MTKRFSVILGSLFVAGETVARVLYVTFPVAMTTYDGIGLNFARSINSPADTFKLIHWSFDRYGTSVQKAKK